MGIIDPHPRNSGGGIQMLRDAGMVVITDVLVSEIAAELGPYLDNTGKAPAPMGL